MRTRYRLARKLLIPAAKPGTGTQTASAPTPLPLQVLSTSCTPSLTGGYYRFGEVRNDQGFPLENLTAEFRSTNAINGDVVTMNALLPLTILDADMSIPFFAYFSPPIFDNPQVELQVQTATSANLENPGIFALKVDQPEISLSADAQWAAVSGGVQLQEPGQEISKFWVAAVAYDQNGQVIGIRRYERTEALKFGEELLFSLNVYSVGGKIDRIELFGEGIP